MRIDPELKLDFNDVLIRPKRSTLSSRKDVSLERTFRFMNSKREWTGIPIIASNMDSTGTFEMAYALSQYKMVTALHKFYSVEELEKFFSEFNNPDYIIYTMGIIDEDFEKLKQIRAEKLAKKKQENEAKERVLNDLAKKRLEAEKQVNKKEAFVWSIILLCE